MPTLTFSEEGHVYRLGDEVLPSVTQLLEAEGFIDRRFYTDHGRDRGTYVHEATALDDQGQLDESSVDPQVAPYLYAWRAFKTSTKCKVLAIEQRVHHSGYLYAGCLDRIIEWNGLRYVIDIKTGSREPWHRVQSAAYAECLPVRHERATVYLTDSGLCSTDRHRDSSDIQVWRAIAQKAAAQRAIDTFKCNLRIGDAA